MVLLAEQHMNAVASETPQSLFFPSPVSTPDWTLEPQQLRRCDGGVLRGAAGWDPE